MADAADGTPISESRANTLQSVIERRNPARQDQDHNADDITVYRVPENYPDFDDVNRINGQRNADFGVMHWDSRINSFNFNRAALQLCKPFASALRLREGLAAQFAKIDAGLSEAHEMKKHGSISSEVVRETYDRALTADEIFIHATGRAAYQFPVSEFNELPLAFFGVQHKIEEDGSWSFPMIDEEKQAALISRLRQELPEHAERYDYFLEHYGYEGAPKQSLDLTEPN